MRRIGYDDDEDFGYGYDDFDDDDLREVVQTRESAWYRFLTSDDTYDPDRLTFDRELLRRHYLANGYADFRVVSAVAELTPDSKAFFVTFTVEEGARYKIGKVDFITALRNLDVEKLREGQTIVPGDWYNADEVEAMIGKLTDAVGVFGYAFVDIRPRVRRDRKTRLIDVAFVIQEGPRVFVETVKISGNARTLDKVIRREILLVEGDAFNISKLRRSRQRIRNLGFFERVEIENKAGSSPDKTVIDVSLKEKSTGEISFGAGFSSSVGVVGDAGIRERNLLGRGQDLELSLQVGERQQQIDLSFTEPYFLGKNLSAGVDVFRTTRDLQSESSFDRETLGFALRSGYRITEPLSQVWKYTLREDKIGDIPTGASLAIKEQEGDLITSSIGQTLRYDKRDSRFNPTDGYFVELQNHGIPLQVKIIPDLLKLAKEFDLKIVGSNDVHYVRGEDWDPHDALLCIQTGSKLDDPKRMRYDGKEFYLKSREEMEMIFREVPEAVTVSESGSDVGSPFWDMFGGLFQKKDDEPSTVRSDSTISSSTTALSAVESEAIAIEQRTSMIYRKIYAFLKTTMRSVAIARTYVADEPNLQIGLQIVYEFLLFIRTIIKVQQANSSTEAVQAWKATVKDFKSIFGPMQERMAQLAFKISKRLERHGKKAKVRLLRFIDIILADEQFLQGLELLEWVQCLDRIEHAVVKAKDWTGLLADTKHADIGAK